MSDTHLLLPGAKTAVLVPSHPRKRHWSYRIIFIIGTVAILAGAADMVARFSYTVLGSCAARTSFGPAIDVIDPGLAQSPQAVLPCRK